MADIGTAYVRIAPNMSGIQGKIASGLKGSGSTFATQFGGEISTKSAVIIGAIAGVAQAAVGKAVSFIGTSLSGAIKRVDTLNSAQKTFQFMGFAADDAKTATTALTKSIEGLPTPLDSAVRGMTSLAATYGNIKVGQKVFTALNDAILGFGGSAVEVEGAVQQLSQLPMDGPLDAQTWNSLRNSGLTPVLVAMSKDFGISVGKLKEAFGSGKLTVKDFTTELMKLDTQGGGGLVSLQKIALNATSGIGTGFANMQTAITRGLAKIIQAVGQKNISQAISNIGKAFETVLGSIAKFITFLNKSGAVLPILIGGLTAFSVAVVASMITSSAAVSAFTASVVAASAAALPFLAIGAAVGAIAFVISKNWSKVQPIVAGVATVFRLLFDTFSGGDPTLKASEQRFAGLAKVFAQVANVVRPVIGFVGNQLKAAFSSLVSIGAQAGVALQPLIKIMGQILANKKVQTVLKIIGVALLAIVAAPIVTFLATVIASITILTKILGFLAHHFTVLKVIMGVLFLPLIASVAIVIASVKLIIATVKLLIKVFTTTFNVIKDIVITTFNAIAAVWNAVLYPVFKVMQTIVQAILTIYLRVWAAIALVVVGTMAIIANIIWKTMQGIWNVIMTIWNAIYAFISSIIGLIAGVLLKAWNFYYSIISTVLKAIWTVVTTVWNTIYGFLAAIFGTIKSVVSGAWNAIYGTISGIVGNIWNSVSGTFNKIVSFAGGIGGRIIKALGNFGGLLYNSGRSLIQGLLNGAGSLLSSIGQFFLDKLPGWIQGPFKKALGIHSPSTVFEGYGQNIGLGLVKGIDGSSGIVTNSVNNMTNSALQGISDPLVNPVAAFGTSPSASAGSSNQSNTTQTVSIQSVVLGDSSAVKEFFKQLNQDTINVGMGLTPIQGAQP